MRLLTGVLKMLVVISAPAYCTVRGIATCIDINLGRAFHFQSIGYLLYDARPGLHDSRMDERGACWPGATTQGLVRGHVPPCKGGGFLRPCRARRSIPKPRALPWAGLRRRFQRRNQSCANPNSRVMMVGHLCDGFQSPTRQSDNHE